MMTDSDLKKIDGNIKKRLDEAKNEWKEDFVDAFAERVSEFKDKVVTMLDAVMGELKKIREEQTLMSNALSEHTDQIEKLDKRVKKTERVLNLS